MARDHDDPWAIDPADFPMGGAFEAQARFLLGYATLAPSGHNTQPWLFEVSENSIDVIADRRRALPVVDPYDREMVISCGAAIANLEVAAAQFGFSSSVTLSPDPGREDTLARVTLANAGAPITTPSALLTAIVNRRTTRARFAGDVPPPGLIEACTGHANARGITLSVIFDKARRREIADLVDQGDHGQFDDPAFRRELASWVHSTRMGSRDGMSGTGFGMPDILAPAARFVMRTFDIGNSVAAANVKAIMEGTPALVLLSSDEDTQDAWLETGRALGRILLELTAQGFTASYLNQPIETPALRPRLREQAGVSANPQILIRVGKAEGDQPATVRRPLDDVIV